MARQNVFGRLYEPRAASTELTVVRDRFFFTKAQDQADLDVITDIIGDPNADPPKPGLPDATRQAIAGSLPLDEYDQQLEEQEYVLRDRLDYYDYTTRVDQRTVADGEWFSPVAVESVCGETAPNVAARMIDGDEATFWRHASNEQHVITFQLRDYPKKIERIRFLYGAGESARERLNNITVKAAKGLARLDDADNILESGINPTWPSGISSNTWVEHTLASKKLKARYVKLEISDTDNGQNQAQIREFEVWVGTRQPEDVDTE